MAMINPIVDPEQERITERLAQAAALRKAGFGDNTGGGYQGGKVFMVGSPLGNIAQTIAGVYLGEKARGEQTALEEKRTQERQAWLDQLPKGYTEKTETVLNGGQPLEAPADQQVPPAGNLTMGVTSPDFLKQDFTQPGVPTGAPQPATFNGESPLAASIAAAPRETVTTQTPLSPLQQAKAMQEWAMRAPRGMEGVQQFALQQAITAPQREAEAAQKREDRIQELKLKAMDIRATQAERLAAQMEIARMQIEGRKEIAGLVASMKASGSGGGGGGAANKEAADLIADRFIAGDKNALIGISRNKELHAAVMGAIAVKAKEQGIDAKELVQRGLEYTGASSEQKTMGNQAANVAMAASEANKMIDIATDLSVKIPRTEFPTINAVGNVVWKQSGDPNVVAFSQAIDSLINGYARAINPKGVATVADKKRAHETLNAAFSNGQFNAVASVMRKEMEAAIAAPQEARKHAREGRVGVTGGKGESSSSKTVDFNSLK